MTTLPRSVARAFLAAIYTYAMIGGATFGLLIPVFNQVSLALISIVLALWLLARWRGRWQWHVTALDVAILLWGLAFGVSLLANAEVWRRIAMGLWYMTLYIGLWYLLHDLVAHRLLNRDSLVNALLIAGVVILGIGFVQLRNWAVDAIPLMLAGTRSWDFPRPGSTIGNPNVLGNFLVLIAPFVVMRFWYIKSTVLRVGLAVYFLAIVFMLATTFSRGPWLAFGATMVMLVVLWLWRRDLLSVARLREWWQSRQLPVKVGLGAGGIIVLLVAVVAAGVIVSTFSRAGRTLGMRVEIYSAAASWFAERPITGHGLFTFGRGLPQYQSMPPLQPHAHAHNLVLNVAAELGVFGLVALGATFYFGGRALLQNWRKAEFAQQHILTAAVAALVGTTLHHLVDMTIMLPGIAITNILVLTIGLSPGEPRHVVDLRQRIQTGVIFVGGVAAVALGFWSVNLHQRYAETLFFVLERNEYVEAAERLQPIIDADPTFPVYHQVQGYLYGAAAGGGDAAALDTAVAAYERYVALEPYYATGWANLAALYWQRGDQNEALQAMETAGELAPLAWSLSYQWGLYAEAVGAGETARRAYLQLLDKTPDVILLPEWSDSAVRRDMSTSISDDDLSIYGRVIYLLDRGDIEAAESVWADSSASREARARRHATDALLALAMNNTESARSSLELGRQIIRGGTEQSMVDLLSARLALLDGDETMALAHIDSAQNVIFPGIFDVDYVLGPNINIIQFLRTTTSRQFLPVVGYQHLPPYVLHLLADTRAELDEG